LKFAISLPAIITGYFKYTNSSKHLVIKFANYNFTRVSFSCVNKAVTVAAKKRALDQPTTKHSWLRSLHKWGLLRDGLIQLLISGI